MNKIKSLAALAAVGSLVASAIALLGSKSTIAGKITYQAKDSENILSNLRDSIERLRGVKRSDAKKPFFFGALAGLLFGASSALLLTPKSGKQIRKNLIDGYQDVADKTTDVIHYIKDNGQKPFSKLNGVVRKKAKRVVATAKRKTSSHHRS